MRNRKRKRRQRAGCGRSRTGDRHRASGRRGASYCCHARNNHCSPDGTHMAKGSRASAVSSGGSSVISGPPAGAPAAAISGATVYGFSAPELMLNQSTQGRGTPGHEGHGRHLGQSWKPTGMGCNLTGRRFDWTPLDQLVASIHAAGLSADLVIDGCPPWAAVSGAQGDNFAQPASPAHLPIWQAVAARYGPRGVNYFEIWNEPNICNSGNPNQILPPTPQISSPHMQRLRRSIRLPLFSPAGSPRPRTSQRPSIHVPSLRICTRMARRVASTGSVTIHIPSRCRRMTTTPGLLPQMSADYPVSRNIMTVNGDSAKKIWITEYGAPTIGSN